MTRRSTATSSDGDRGERTTRIHTVGHSTRSAEELLALLEHHGIRRVLDVRTAPRSRQNPQFSEEELSAFLREHGVGYERVPELGGWRKVAQGSPNGAWRNRAFQGYADHMLTEEFERGLERVLEAAEFEPVAVMCAEALPWRCHRSLIADALVARGHDVLDIISDDDARPHALRSFARVEGNKVTYPPNEEGSQGETD